MSNINYRKSSKAIILAWFIYKATNPLSPSVTSFVAGFNAAKKEKKIRNKK